MVTRDELYQWYVVEGLSLRQVAAKFGLSPGTVRYHMHRCGIPRRTKSEAVSGERNPMHGKVKPLDVRRRTSETLAKTNADPLVKSRRSAASSGERNSMFGKSHTEVSRSRMSQSQKARCTIPEVRQALSQQAKQVWTRPEVRRVLVAKAKQRTAERNPFFGRTHTEATKQKISEANHGRLQGERGPNWQGGKTSINLLVRNSEDAVRWRLAVFKRDTYTCQSCGKVGGPLHADHIRPLALLLRENHIQTLAEAQACEALWDITNGRTLCKPCHKKTPSFAGNFQKNYKSK